VLRVLGNAGYQAAYDRGVDMTLRQVVDFAASNGSTGPVERADTSRPALTRRERQVADLVAEGLTNREIAARLTIAPRTAESHVSTVLTKLGMSPAQLPPTRASSAPGGAPSHDRRGRTQRR